MVEHSIVKIDEGAINARILAGQAKADFRRVEAASLKMRTHFTSSEAKRIFVRMFSTLQLNAYFISSVARTRLEPREVEAAEAALSGEMERAKATFNQAIDGAEALFTVHGIRSAATYDTQALEIEVGILSSSGRRYLELLNQLDQLMPLLQTLEIHEVITTQSLDKQRAKLKRVVRNIALSSRRLATGLRQAMHLLAAGGDLRDAAALEDRRAAQVGVATPPEGGSSVAVAMDTAGERDSGRLRGTGSVMNGDAKVEPVAGNLRRKGDLHEGADVTRTQPAGRDGVFNASGQGESAPGLKREHARASEGEASENRPRAGRGGKVLHKFGEDFPTDWDIAPGSAEAPVEARIEAQVETHAEPPVEVVRTSADPPASTSTISDRVERHACEVMPCEVGAVPADRCDASASGI